MTAIWIFISSIQDSEPEVFKSLNEAVDFAIDELKEHREYWDYLPEDFDYCIEELYEGVRRGSNHLGTELGEFEVDIYQRFI